MSIHPYHLGASLYMPATRHDIWQIINRQKLTNIDSIIICLEDAVHKTEVATALTHVKTLLDTWHQHQSCHDTSQSQYQQRQHQKSRQNQPYPNKVLDRPLVFIRPRQPAMLADLATWANIHLVDGFVLPKFDLTSLPNWQTACQHISTTHLLMPTLETAAIFDPTHNMQLVNQLDNAFVQRVFALRIGGNDLFACLRMRRPENVTIYQTPIAGLIYQLLGCFVPKGYYLSAPVFEYINQPTLFAQELEQDAALGLVGKTIIHPKQIAMIKQAFQPTSKQLAHAHAVLQPDAKAVFKQDDSMLEPATHQAWAKNIMVRQQVFGIADDK